MYRQGNWTTREHANTVGVNINLLLPKGMQDY